MDMNTLKDEVNAVLGSDRTAAWFQTPHAYLDWQTPWEAGQTLAGFERLRKMISALLDGAFL